MSEFTPTHFANTPEDIRVLVLTFGQHMDTLPGVGFAADTEFHNGTYPDSEMTHLTLHTPGTTVLLEFPDQAARTAMAQAWNQSGLYRHRASLHFGQDDMMLLMREGCIIHHVVDTGLIANHLSLQQTAMKDLAKEYKLFDKTISYWSLLKQVIPFNEADEYIKGANVIKAYDLRRVTDPEKRALVHEYCGQDGVIGFKLSKYMIEEILYKMYDNNTLGIMFDAQFGSAVYLAQHNARGYPIDIDSLKTTLAEFEAEVEDLEKRGMAMVREAMQWDRPPENSILALLADTKPEARPMSYKRIDPPDVGYVDLSNTPRSIQMLSDGTWISTDPERPSKPKTETQEEQDASA